MQVRFLQPDQAGYVRERLNGDREFQLAANSLSKDILLEVGTEKCILKLHKGQVTDVVLPAKPVMYDRSDVYVRAPAEAWERFLRPVPPPFYHCLTGAAAHHEFEWGGDLETLFGYFWAFDRMFDVLRELQNE